MSRILALISDINVVFHTFTFRALFVVNKVKVLNSNIIELIGLDEI